MTFQNIAFWLAFSSLVVIGLGLKAATLISGGEGDKEINAFERIEPVLYRAGYRFRDIKRPTTDKNFVVHIYQQPGCGGHLVLLPLSRNSEASQLLKSRFPSTQGQAYFVFQGQRFDDFPGRQFWWHGVYSTVKNWGQKKNESTVWSVVETRPCINSTAIHRYL